MARPLSTYRAARAQLAIITAKPMLALTTTPKGSPIRRQKALQVMPEPTYRPVQPKGWDWRKGGRAAREAEKAQRTSIVVMDSANGTPAGV